MNAQLDNQPNYGELVGGSRRTGYKLSDPRMDHKLQLIPPYTPTTDAQRRSIVEQVEAAYPDTTHNAHLTAREELLNMILSGEVP